MGKFLNGVLIGVGIGMLVAPMPGSAMRQMLGERLQALGDTLSQNEQLNEIVQRATGPDSPVERGLKNLADRAVNRKNATDTMVRQSYKPAYPEYVNPDLKS
jgi:gas vesicle protein